MAAPVQARVPPIDAFEVTLNPVPEAFERVRVSEMSPAPFTSRLVETTEPVTLMPVPEIAITSVEFTLNSCCLLVGTE